LSTLDPTDFDEEPDNQEMEMRSFVDNHDSLSSVCPADPDEQEFGDQIMGIANNANSSESDALGWSTCHIDIWYDI
jgi:hypothetical protein